MKFDDLFEPNHTQHCDFIQNSIKINPKRFINLYLKWGKEYPHEYMKAFVLNTHLSWYPYANHSAIGQFNYIWTKHFYRKSFWGTEIKSSESLIPPLKKLYDKIFMEMRFEENLFLKVMFSLGWNFWIVFTSLLIIAYRKSYGNLIPFVFIAALFFTILFAPLVILRYVWQDFIILPLLFVCTFTKIGQKDFENNR